MAASPHNADANLLFGMVALQMDFITRDQLIAGMQAWINDKKLPLADHLVRTGMLKAELRRLLEPLVSEHIRQHANDPQQSLAAVRSIDSLRGDLQALDDHDIEASLVALPVQHAMAPPCGEPTQTFVGHGSGEGKRFRIVRPHARGGLGEVFVAEDQELHREVALKEIQADYAHDPFSRSRFLLEAEITGCLEHPGIVPVYGLGQYSDGRPFYAMRFIRGDSLKEAVDRLHKSSPHVAYDSAEFRKLLGRFVDVCNAIEYAHSRGVLHRDLKPGNIMLGKYGETLVVDWGLAKAQGRQDHTERGGETTLRPRSASGSSHTQMGEAVGTPAYMSPEQAAGRLGDLGVASDVYSLGATLYYLLTGRAPFNKTDEGDILRKVERGEFPTPRSLNPGIPKPLEAICLRAMSARPQSRYASPNALADDIERYLADEPLAALPDSLADRVNRFARRNRTLVRSAAAALLVVAVVSTVAALIVNEQRQQNGKLAKDNGELAEAQSKLADEKSRLAEEMEKQSSRRELNFNRAMEAVDKMLTRVGEERLASVPEMGPVRKAILEDALKLYDDLLSENGESPELQREIARASQRVAMIDWLLGKPEAAIEAFKRAIVSFTSLDRQQLLKQVDVRDLAICYRSLAMILQETGNYSEAITAFQTATATLRPFGKNDSFAEAEFVQGSGLFAAALLADGQQSEAANVLREAIEIGERNLERNPKEHWGFYSHRTAGRCQQLGELLASQAGQEAEAEQRLKRAIEITEVISNLGATIQWGWSSTKHVADPNDFHSFSDALASCYQSLAQFLRRQGREDEAKAYEEKIVGIRPQAIEKMRRNAEQINPTLYLTVIGRDCADQARLLLQRQERGEAIVYYRKAIDAYRQAAELNPQVSYYHLQAMENGIELALQLSAQADGKEEGLALLASLAAEARGEEFAVKMITALQKAAIQLRNSVDLPSAEAPLRLALDLAKEMNDTELANPSVQHALSLCHHNLGDVLLFAHQKPAEAADEYAQARLLEEQAISERGINRELASELGWSCQNGGSALLRMKPDATLVAVAIRAVEMRVYLLESEATESSQSNLRDSLRNLGLALAWVSDVPKADLEKAASLAGDQTYQSPDNGPAWRVRGVAEFRLGNYADSVTALQAAISAKLVDPAIDELFLAMALAKTGHVSEAQRSLDAGREWISKNRPNHAQFRSLHEQAVSVVEGK